VKEPTFTREMLNDLCALEDGLTDWEVEFIERMSRQSSWSHGQLQKLTQIWEDRC